jgi:hypothetical protein
VSTGKSGQRKQHGGKTEGGVEVKQMALKDLHFRETPVQ